MLIHHDTSMPRPPMDLLFQKVLGPIQLGFVHPQPLCKPTCHANRVPASMRVGRTLQVQGDN
jgi:hypothetical protein